MSNTAIEIVDRFHDFVDHFVVCVFLCMSDVYIIVNKLAESVLNCIDFESHVTIFGFRRIEQCNWNQCHMSEHLRNTTNKFKFRLDRNLLLSLRLYVHMVMRNIAGMRRIYTQN